LINRFCTLACLLALLAGCAAPSTTSTTPAVALPAPAAQPEGGSGLHTHAGWATQHFAVAAADARAAQAGYQMIKAGGSAVDAAIAVQMVLALVEPQSSGLGGGAFMLYANGRQVQAFDGRETAPASADGKLFLQADGQPMPFREALVGGRSVGVPGVLPMLELAHRQHGRLPWARLFEPAIALAENGFVVGARLHSLLAQDPILCKDDPVADAYFCDAAGQPWPTGHLLKNPEMAAQLRAIAQQGAKALSTGPIAQAMVDKVRQHPRNPGQLALADLAGYQPRLRQPLCVDYTAHSLRGAARDYRICGMPPPSSGAIAVAQILGLMNLLPRPDNPLSAGPSGAPFACVAEPCPIAPLAPSADWLHLYTEAARLASADRDQYLGDPDFVTPPAGNWMSLLAPAYLRERAQLVQSGPGGKAMPSVAPGRPGGMVSAYAPMAQQPEYGTSHITVVDAQGNALSMTTSVEYAFGAHQMVNRGQGLPGGFLLNNQLTDFSWKPVDANGRPVANRVEPGKRPRSAMAPTLVFERLPNGQTGPLVLAGGSAGGPAIIHYTAKALYGMLNWGLDAQQAIDLPNFSTFSGPTQLESGRFAAGTLQALRAREHPVVESGLNSGSQFIQKTPQGFFGGADPRREGAVQGD
jgi:gamma-glutamyltranspeptidase/glutathione hydrolase